MQNSELKPCANCGRGIAGGGAGPMVGARVTVQRLIVNPGSLCSHLGLEQHFAQAGPAGARVLADVMGPGSVVDEPAELRGEFLLCERCVLEPTPPVLVLLENANKESEVSA